MLFKNTTKQRLCHFFFMHQQNGIYANLKEPRYFTICTISETYVFAI